MKQIVQDQLRQLNIKPNHQLGQNFLIDPTVIETSLQATQLQPTDTVVEIGPGLGMLTVALAQTVQRVIAIELDAQFKPVLEKLQKKHSNLEIIWGDALKVDLAQYQLEAGQYSVVANLPYQITSHFLQRYLTTAPYPKQMILLIQKEVAERIIARPGQLSILGLSVQLFCDPEYIQTVGPEAFLPAPKVASAIIALRTIRQFDQKFNQIDPRSKIMHSPSTEKLFFSLIRAAFAQKRKKLLNNLKHIQFQGITMPPEFFQKQLHELHLSENVRAQELSLLQWLIMVDKVESFIYN